MKGESLNEESINILLVEDNPGDVRLLRMAMALAGAQNIELVPVEDLKTAFARLSQQSFAAVLLDLMLPDCMGIDTLHRLHGEFPDVPIIILTGTEDERIAMQAIRAGAQDFLVKGKVNTERLLNTILTAIERHRLRVELDRKDRELAEMVDNFRHIADASPAGIACFSPDQRLLYANGAARRLLGIDGREPAGAGLGLPFELGDPSGPRTFERKGRVLGLEMRRTIWDGATAFLARLEELPVPVPS